MDFLFISMPYARFISRWFANIPNINLGIMQAFLSGKGKSVKSFHFHLDFLPYVKSIDPRLWEKFLTQTEQLGVEYMGLDYAFASLFFEQKYQMSKNLFHERLDSMELTVNDFEQMRDIARSFCDSCFVKLSPYLKKIKLVGFSCSHYQLSGSLLLCSKIKNAYPDLHAIFGGKDCTGAFTRELLTNVDFVDFAGTSECEVTVESLLEHLDDSSKKFYNIAYRDENGVINDAESRPNLPINSLPFPEYDFDSFPVEKGELILPIEFGRGCPWKRCTFCPDESYHIQCQTKTEKRLTEEFQYYRGISTDLKNFFIVDSDALKDKKTIVNISHSLEGRDLNFHYAEFRAERMDREVLTSILHFGNWISNFQIGIETFSDSLLKLMNKGVTMLKNVEVIKAAAELRVPIQFNLFTCYPKMTKNEVMENLRVMDSIAHLLVHENIQVFPGEFYLPTDCAVFFNPEDYGIKKHHDNLFSSIFEGFPMPSYSNYPYPYLFDNDEEQFHLSGVVRNKVEEIKGKKPEDTFMVYENTADGLLITAGRDGNRTSYTLSALKKDVYLSAVEELQQISVIADKLHTPPDEIISMLNDFEQQGLILFSSNRKSFLSLATKSLR
jgi:hypothetical protein